MQSPFQDAAIDSFNLISVGTLKSFILAVTELGFPPVQFFYTMYMQHVPSYLY